MRGHRQIYFLTSNKGKFREASAVVTASGLELRMLATTKIEIQSDDLQRIASYAAEEAASRLGIPIIAEDAGLFIEALNGFPGPNSSYVFKRLGITGVLALMKNVSRREASFRSAVAFCEPKHKAKCFTGLVAGRISAHPRGSGGFGFDPIFIPNRGDGRTFAEMTDEEKNRISHRAASFRKLSRRLSALQA